jgi:hypothetical protein
MPKENGMVLLIVISGFPVEKMKCHSSKSE